MKKLLKRVVKNLEESCGLRSGFINNFLMQLRSLPYNRGMSHLDILLPFGLPPQELAADFFRELKVPALSTLIARAKPERGEQLNDLARALPHEVWIARQFGLEDATRSGGSPPIAVAALHELGLTDEPGTWFIINPVHFHIARDHLVLTDPRQLQLTDAESRTLFDIAQQLFAEAGKPLQYGNAETWFARADDWSGLQTSTPDAATGHNIDIWMPKGEGERNWRKLQNEVQMHWFTHPINADREARGAKPVNSIWLWAGTPASTPRGAARYTEVFNLGGWMQALAQFAAKRADHPDAQALIAAPPERGLLLLDTLIEPTLANDWSQWLAALHKLEAEWFAPLLESLKSGKINHLSLVATDQARLSTFNASRNSLRKFWVKPSLAPLLS
jgi:hypothetical protein